MALAIGIAVAVPKNPTTEGESSPIGPNTFVADDAKTQEYYVDDAKTQTLETTDP